MKVRCVGNFVYQLIFTDKELQIVQRVATNLDTSKSKLIVRLLKGGLRLLIDVLKE